MKKNFFIIILLMLGYVQLNAQDSEFVEIKKAAADIIYDVAHGSIDHFNILKPEEVPLVFKNQRFSERVLEWFSDKETMENDVIEIIKEKGIEAGLDWNDVTITDVRYRGSYDEEFGAEELRGYIYVRSHNNPYRIYFKRCFMLDGKCRIISLRYLEKKSEMDDEDLHSGRNYQ